MGCDDEPSFGGVWLSEWSAGKGGGKEKRSKREEETDGQLNGEARSMFWCLRGHRFGTSGLLSISLLCTVPREGEALPPYYYHHYRGDPSSG